MPQTFSAFLCEIIEVTLLTWTIVMQLKEETKLNFFKQNVTAAYRPAYRQTPPCILLTLVRDLCVHTFRVLIRFLWACHQPIKTGNHTNVFYHVSETEMEESLKALQWGGTRATEGPQWGPGATAPVGVRRQSPWSWRLFSKSTVWKPPFPGTLSCFKQPLTKYSVLRWKAFFQRNKPGLDKHQ